MLHMHCQVIQEKTVMENFLLGAFHPFSDTTCNIQGFYCRLFETVQFLQFLSISTYFLESLGACFAMEMLVL